MLDFESLWSKAPIDRRGLKAAIGIGAGRLTEFEDILRSGRWHWFAKASCKV